MDQNGATSVKGRRRRAAAEPRARRADSLDPAWYKQAIVYELHDSGVGSISEIFDAEPPYTPRGCIAQAWIVAEVLRCWAKTGE